MPVNITKTTVAESLFDTFRKNMASGLLKSKTSNSILWLQRQAKAAVGINRRALVANAPSNTKLEIGSMYMFFYEALHDKTLQYWDRFPLVIPIEIYNDGFLGLNLHYLSPLTRAKFLDKLMDFRNTKGIDEKTRLIMSYKLLTSASRYGPFKPCIKRYLSLQVQSNLLKVEPQDWSVAIFLPVEMFQKEKARKVWKDSDQQVS